MCIISLELNAIIIAVTFLQKRSLISQKKVTLAEDVSFLPECEMTSLSKQVSSPETKAEIVSSVFRGTSTLITASKDAYVSYNLHCI